MTDVPDRAVEMSRRSRRPIVNGVHVRRDVRIPTADSKVTLSGDLYLPIVDGPVPVLVTALPYRKDAEWGSSYEWFAHRGYACLLINLRGTGSSDGDLRSPFHPAEADDAIAAIDWSVAQPWCDGSVGMWGGSYGAVMALRAASRRPTHLRAIVALDGMIDPRHDFAYPFGSRGALTVAQWGAGTFMDQLLPPLSNHPSAAEQNRWRHRLQSEPHFLSLLRNGDDTEFWGPRRVDVSLIQVPSFCVTGWEDAFCHSALRGYELIRAPKRLLVGPWGHALPEQASLEKVDFHRLALEWWDYWLRGYGDDPSQDPQSTIYVQGHDAEWRAYQSWPPVAASKALEATPEQLLTDPERPASAPKGHVVAEYTPDPTVGSLSDMWGLLHGGLGNDRLDQHDDDARSAAVTSQELPDDLLIIGVPQVTLRWAGGPEGAAGMARVSARLVDVHPDGRGRLITGGVLCTLPESSDCQLELWPTAYRVAAGHRLRLSISDAAFPWLWPLPKSAPISIAALQVLLPEVQRDAGVKALPPRPEEDSSEFTGLHSMSVPEWIISREPIRQRVEIVLGSTSRFQTPSDGHWLETHSRCCAAVARDAPEAAVVECDLTKKAIMSTGEVVEATVYARMTSSAFHLSGQVAVDGHPIVSKTWLI